MTRIRPPLQERSQQSLGRMLDAAEAILAEQGASGLTISLLVKRSETSIGAFYARFVDKSALLQVVQDRVLSRTEEVIASSPLERWAGSSLASAVGRLTRFLFGMMNQPKLFASFIGAAVEDAAMRKRGGRTIDVLSKWFSGALTVHAGEIGHADRERAIHFAFQLCIAFLERQVVFGAAGTTTSRRTSLAEQSAELAKAVLAYLRGSKRFSNSVKKIKP